MPESSTPTNTQPCIFTQGDTPSSLALLDVATEESLSAFVDSIPPLTPWDRSFRNKNISLLRLIRVKASFSLDRLLTSPCIHLLSLDTSLLTRDTSSIRSCTAPKELPFVLGRGVSWASRLSFSTREPQQPDNNQIRNYVRQAVGQPITLKLFSLRHTILLPRQELCVIFRQLPLQVMIIFKG
jgi:hypothetical protein